MARSVLNRKRVDYLRFYVVADGSNRPARWIENPSGARLKSFGKFRSGAGGTILGESRLQRLAKGLMMTVVVETVDKRSGTLAAYGSCVA